MLRSRRRAALQAWLERVETVLADQREREGRSEPGGRPGGALPVELVPLPAEDRVTREGFRLDLGA